MSDTTSTSIVSQCVVAELHLQDVSRQKSTNNIIIGHGNEIPDHGAHNCIIVGTGIKLTPSDQLQNVLYIGSETTLINVDHRIAQLIDSLNDLLRGKVAGVVGGDNEEEASKKTVQCVMVGVGGERFINLGESLASLEAQIDKLMQNIGEQTKLNIV